MRELSRNERRLIELIRAEGGSRVELARDTGLTPPSITRLTAGLIDLELLEEHVERTGRPGQPKKNLFVRKEHLFAAGINLGPDQCHINLVSLAGAILEETTFHVKGRNAAEVAKVAAAAIDNMKWGWHIPENRFVGTGCAVAAKCTSTVGSPDELKFREAFIEAALRGDFAAGFGGGVRVETRGNGVVLAEYIFSEVATNYRDIYVLEIDEELDGGAVLDGRIVRGVSGNTHFPKLLFPADGPRPTALDLFGELAENGFVAGFDELEKLTKEGNVWLGKWKTRAEGQVAFALNIISSVLDPDLFILSGRLPQSIKWGHFSFVGTVSPLGGRARPLAGAALAFYDSLYVGGLDDQDRFHLDKAQGLTPITQP